MASTLEYIENIIKGIGTAIQEKATAPGALFHKGVGAKPDVLPNSAANPPSRNFLP